MSSSPAAKKLKTGTRYKQSYLNTHDINTPVRSLKGDGLEVVSLQNIALFKGTYEVGNTFFLPRKYNTEGISIKKKHDIKLPMRYIPLLSTSAVTIQQGEKDDEGQDTSFIKFKQEDYFQHWYPLMTAIVNGWGKKVCTEIEVYRKKDLYDNEIMAFMAAKKVFKKYTNMEKGNEEVVEYNDALEIKLFVKKIDDSFFQYRASYTRSDLTPSKQLIVLTPEWFKGFIKKGAPKKGVEFEVHFMVIYTYVCIYNVHGDKLVKGRRNAFDKLEVFKNVLSNTFEEVEAADIPKYIKVILPYAKMELNQTICIEEKEEKQQKVALPKTQKGELKGDSLLELIDQMELKGYFPFVQNGRPFNPSPFIKSFERHPFSFRDEFKSLEGDDCGEDKMLLWLSGYHKNFAGLRNFITANIRLIANKEDTILKNQYLLPFLLKLKDKNTSEVRFILSLLIFLTMLIQDTFVSTRGFIAYKDLLARPYYCAQKQKKHPTARNTYSKESLMKGIASKTLKHVFEVIPKTQLALYTLFVASHIQKGIPEKWIQVDISPGFIEEYYRVLKNLKKITDLMEESLLVDLIDVDEDNDSNDSVGKAEVKDNDSEGSETTTPDGHENIVIRFFDLLQLTDAPFIQLYSSFEKVRERYSRYKTNKTMKTQLFMFPYVIEEKLMNQHFITCIFDQKRNLFYYIYTKSMDLNILQKEIQELLGIKTLSSAARIEDTNIYEENVLYGGENEELTYVTACIRGCQVQKFINKNNAIPHELKEELDLEVGKQYIHRCLRHCKLKNWDRFIEKLK